MPSLIEATKSLANLRALPAGWDYGKGSAVSPQSVAYGVMLLQILARLGAANFDVVPGDEGGAIVVAYSNNKSAEIHCKPSGEFDLLHENASSEEVYSEHLSMAQLITSLEKFGWQSPRFYASCTRNVMSRESGDMLDWLSEIRLAGAFRSLAPIVSLGVKRTPVNTFVSTMTNGRAESRQSSGEYVSRAYQKALA